MEEILRLTPTESPLLELLEEQGPVEEYLYEWWSEVLEPLTDRDICDMETP